MMERHLRNRRRQPTIYRKRTGRRARKRDRALRGGWRSQLSSISWKKSLVSKEVGALTSLERENLITVVICMNAVGNYIPPLIIWPRKNIKLELMDNAPKVGWTFFRPRCDDRDGDEDDERVRAHFPSRRGKRVSSPAIAKGYHHRSGEFAFADPGRGQMPTICTKLAYGGGSSDAGPFSVMDDKQAKSK
ncbi:hypothetical protein ALC60_10945 [Trachymyrmex zeteki]|uniref:Uncharacterized protein n=1 Tax=Mycetomoellerius zeteki TaxID=64791 RepID=A0A151WPY1_9HYME|nr:hypothetical protein ALC60_10945 [Trachymyrmex zeteki]